MTDKKLKREADVIPPPLFVLKKISEMINTY